MTTPWSVTIDCTDPSLLAGFWALALGYRPADPPRGFDSWDDWFERNGVPESERDDGAALQDPDGILPSITLLKVPEGKSAKNRWHPDLQVSGGRAQDPALRASRIEAKVGELESAGGYVLHRAMNGDSLDHVMMADPEANEFCVV